MASNHSFNKSSSGCLSDEHSFSSEEQVKSTLSEEQARVIELVKDERNVFITGSAGVGKSFLLQEIIKSLPNKKTYVTASTGVAACNIGGSTLHSFAGIGLGDKDAKHYGHMIKLKRYKIEVKERWTGCEVLIIDEISMVDGNLFTKVEEVARIVRGDVRPFGGIQIVLCGDFLQLPPVKSQLFAFETKAWKRSINRTIVLNKVFRQKHFGFISLLNRLRVGVITSTDVEVLHYCHRTMFPDDGIKPTCLYPHRSSCDKVNISELEKLPGKMEKFEATDFAVDEFYRKQIESTCKYPKVLSLKGGAQVMLLYNKDISGGLVNGARGVVIGFENKIQELEEQLKILSQHEDEDNNDLLLAKTLLITKMKKVQESGSCFPIVRFTNGVEIVISPQQNIIEILGRTMAYRTQIPLALAWAVSVHKSQGVTLDRVELNIANAFEHGQGYVALSRVTSLDGLLLRGFDPSKITAHPKVLLYYNSVDSSFPNCTKGMGEEELKQFIEKRKDHASYRQEIAELTKKAKEAQRVVSSLQFEHNYSKHDSPATSEKHHFTFDSTPTTNNHPQSNSSSTNTCGTTSSTTYHPCLDTSCSSTCRTTTLSNVIDLTGELPSKGIIFPLLSIQSSCNNTQSSSKGCASEERQNTPLRTGPPSAGSSDHLSTRSSEPGSFVSSTLDKASQLLNKCILSLNDIQSTPSLTPPISTPILSKTPKRTCIDLTASCHEVSLCVRNRFNCKSNKNTASSSTKDQLNNTLGSNSNNTIQSNNYNKNKNNDEIEESFFDDDDDDNDFSENIIANVPTFEQKKATVAAAQQQQKTPITRNYFFNNICSDLLQSAEKNIRRSPFDQGKNTKRSCTRLRGQKRARKSDDAADELAHGSVSKKVHECKQSGVAVAATEDEARIKKLLKEKEATIEENRRKALVRRLNSLKRSTSGF